MIESYGIPFVLIPVNASTIIKSGFTSNPSTTFVTPCFVAFKILISSITSWPIIATE